MARSELYYNNQALFVGPTPCTGQHFTSGNSGQNLIRELFRITKYNNSFDIPKEDVVQLGQLAAFARVQNSAPNPKWDIEFYTNDGVNEQRLGFPIDGATALLSGILTSLSDDKNYFGLISAEGVDSDGDTNTSAQYVECMGNGYVSNIRYSAAVGGFSMCSVSVEGSNFAVYSGSTGLTIPAVDPVQGTIVSTWNFTIPEPAVSGDSPSMPTVLKYGDITVNMGSTTGLIGAIFASGPNAAHIQSFDLSVPIPREAILQLGNKYPYARKIRPPFNAVLSISAIQNEHFTGNLYNVINSCAINEYPIYINFNACSGSTFANVFNITCLGASLDSEDFSISATQGGKKMVTAKFTIPMGGINDVAHQIFLSGTHPGSYPTGVL